MPVMLSQLQEKLQKLVEGGVPGDSEVRVAYQPSWPLQVHVSDDVIAVQIARNESDVSMANQVLGDSDSDPADRETARGILDKADDSPIVVYLAEGAHIPDHPYLPSTAQSKLGWGR